MKGTNHLKGKGDLLNSVMGLGAALFFLLSISSCSNTKYLGTNESLLVSNKIKIKDVDGVKDRRPLKNEIEVIPAQKANRKTFGLGRLKLLFYNSIGPKKEKKKFYAWLKYKVGEPPVIFDSATVNQTVNLMKNYLFNKGYFSNSVIASVETKDHKTSVTYSIRYDSPYTLWTIQFPQDTSAISTIIQKKSSASLLKYGAPFDVSVLKLEMERVAADLRNQGYYYMNRDRVSFDLDTSEYYKHINVTLRISPPENGGRHEPYHLNKVRVYSNYLIDTKAQRNYPDSSESRGLYFYTDERKFNPKRLSEFIFTQPGALYSQDRQQQSVKRLVNLGVFKFVNMDVKDVSDSNSRLLDMYYYLTPTRKQFFSIDFDQNYSNLGLLSSGINFNYKNRNLSKNADMLAITLTSGIQFSIKRNSTNSTIPIDKTSLIYLADVGAEISYQQNRFLVPFKVRRYSYTSNPRTKISIGYNFQKRFGNYSLHRVNLKYGFDWKTSSRLRHIFNLVDLNLLTFRNRTPEFEQRLAETPSLRYSFSQGLIPSTNYSLIYSGQKGPDDNAFVNYSLSIDLAGNLFYGFSKLVHIKDGVTAPYKIFKTEISQFVRIDNDLRAYFVNSDKSALVGRIYAGVGIPYGNSRALPFIRQFFIGGGNSVRAFAANTVGPGSYVDSIVFKNPRNALQSGDVKIEANIEYRFNIYRWFKGALFADAGNVWLLRKDPERPGAEFNFKTFWKQMAVGVGAGVRADFDFFVLRFDVGMPLVDPRMPEGQRWLLNQYSMRKEIPDGKRRIPFNLNLAIGYPF